MSLVTVARYRFITRDVCTDDETVSARLEEAQSLIEDEYRRPLESAERTETLALWPDGRVYPAAVPITAVPEDAAYAISDQATLTGSFPHGSTGWGAWSDCGAEATVVYTGGWTAETVPAWLEHAIADLAHALGGGSSGSASAVPVGATAASVGDVSVTFGAGSGSSSSASGLDGYLAGIGARTARLWRPRLRP